MITPVRKSRQRWTNCMHSGVIQTQCSLSFTLVLLIDTHKAMTSAQKHPAHFTAAPYWALPPQHPALPNPGPTFQDTHTHTLCYSPISYGLSSLSTVHLPPPLCSNSIRGSEQLI